MVVGLEPISPKEAFLMKKAVLFLLLLCLPTPYALGDDPDIGDYLQNLDQAYYSLSREGLKSFQCHATSTFTGQPPLGIENAFEGFNWQPSRCVFDFSYPGEGVQPFLSFSSNGGDPQATPARMRLISNLTNIFLEIWGILSTNDLFGRYDKDWTNSIVRGKDQTFTIQAKSKNAFYSIGFDAKALANRFIVKAPNMDEDVTMECVQTPRGVVISRMGSQTDTKNGPLALDFVPTYKSVQGYLLPDTLDLYVRTTGRLFQIHYQMSDYQLQNTAQVAVEQDNGDTQIVPASSENPGTKHFFWRARSATATVYLLGSIHIRRNKPLQVPEIVEKSFQASDYVGFEFDLSQWEQVKKDMPDYFRTHCVYPPGDSLKNHLKPSQWKLIKKFAKKSGIPMDQIIIYKPYVLDDVIPSKGDDQTGYLHEYGIDEIFMRKAQAAKKPIFGMEFWYEPFQDMDTLSDKDQASILFGSSQGSSNKYRFMDEILADWKTGNTTDLDSLVNQDISAEDKAVMDKILKYRNEKWMGQFDRIFQGRGTYFIVVGSAHLVGEFGLPERLRRKGYEVEQY